MWNSGRFLTRADYFWKRKKRPKLEGGCPSVWSEAIEVYQLTVITEHEQHFRISTYFESVEHGSVAFLCESHAQVFRHEDLFPEITITLQIPISNVLIREHTILVNTFKYKVNVAILGCYFWIYVNYKNKYLDLSILSLVDATVWTLLLDTTLSLSSDISIYNCNKCI